MLFFFFISVSFFSFFFFFLMIRRPPRSTLFPYRRSSDLGVRAPHHAERHRVSAPALRAEVPPRQPPGAHLRLLRRAPHPPALPGRLGVGEGADLHRERDR